jgi:CubicO group peptidase (beta-lactamase class C family)
MGTDAKLAEAVRGAIEDAIATGQTPGAVCLIGRGDEALCLEAVGERSWEPERLPMEPDTVFDMASVTKVVATTTVVMRLVERGVLALEDPVQRWLPEFPDGRVTLRHLLAHSSGLPAHRNYPTLLGYEVPPEERWERVVGEICRLPQEYEPGEGTIYSCLGFILLTHIVRLASGRGLAELAHEGAFGPLAMSDTGFCPPADIIARCAATERLPEGVLLGDVHDENSRYLGGAGGNAGLFSTAADLWRFMRMILAGGELDGARVLRPETVAMMLEPQAGSPDGRRCIGWRLGHASDPQMHGAPTPESVGHTGYTGTCVWGDRASGVIVILLANRVHISREADVEQMRREIGALAAEVAE